MPGAPFQSTSDIRQPLRRRDSPASSPTQPAPRPGPRHRWSRCRRLRRRRRPLPHHHRPRPRPPRRPAPTPAGKPDRHEGCQRPAANLPVDGIHACRTNGDADLAGVGVGFLDVDDLEDVRTAVLEKRLVSVLHALLGRRVPGEVLLPNVDTEGLPGLVQVLRDGDGIVTVQDAVVVPHHDRGVPGHQMRIGVGVLRSRRLSAVQRKLKVMAERGTSKPKPQVRGILTALRVA